MLTIDGKVVNGSGNIDNSNLTGETLPKFIDVNDNIYTWKTTKVFKDGVTSLTGTVKTHNDYKGIKQTELTRCKVA